MTKTPHQLIKSRQSPYNHYRDKALMLLYQGGQLETRYIGICGDCECSDIFNEDDVLSLFEMWDHRVYGDEIPLPDAQFAWDRADHLCERKEPWAWPAAIAWKKFLRRIMNKRLTD